MLEKDCLFCKILRREIPAEIVHEDDDVFGMKDINPQAPVHELFIPKIHVSTTNDVDPEGALLMGRLILAAVERAKASGVADQGYRMVLNCNREAGQSVFHIHLHLLGGRPLSWPPG